MGLKEDAYRYAIKNAYLHDGKAELRAVVGKVAALHKEIDLKKVMPTLEEIVDNINSMSLSAIKKEYEKFEGSYELKPKEKEEGLPKLEWAEKGEKQVVTRYAPNPNGPFHLGNARAAIISYEYAKRYNGKFILRFDDTDPKVKRPLEDAEQVFANDLAWLGCKPDEVCFASDRLEIYYKYIRELIELGKAYVCSCKPEDWRAKIQKMEACPCRELGNEENLKRFEAMLKHEYTEGEAVVRIKTDLQHADPSIRDWWAAKVVDVPEHPRAGNKFHVWPSYNLASGVDDHELGITLIIRGQEHEQNMTKQKYMYEYLGWKYPHAFHFGRIKLGDLILSTSKISKGIEEGEYEGWDDVRLGTIQALRRRGFDARTLREAIMDIGVKPVDVSIEMAKLADLNKKYIEGKSKRITFISDGIYLDVNYARHKVVEKDGKKYSLKEGTQRFVVSRSEFADVPVGKVVRMRNAYNVKVMQKDDHQIITQYVGDSGSTKTKVIPWVIKTIDAELLMPDNTEVKGVIDKKVFDMKFRQMLFLEKIGYAIIDALEQSVVKLIFTHE